MRTITEHIINGGRTLKLPVNCQVLKKVAVIEGDLVIYAVGDTGAPKTNATFVVYTTGESVPYTPALVYLDSAKSHHVFIKENKNVKT